VAGLDGSGSVVLRRKVKRESLIVMAESFLCASSAWRRAEAPIISGASPQYVRPYAKAQNTDDHDAEGIAEAAMRPTMRLAARHPPGARNGRAAGQAEARAIPGRDGLTVERRSGSLN